MERQRIRPHRAVIGLGVLVALFTAGSGLAAAITGFHDDSPITREVFGNVPGAVSYTHLTLPTILLV